MSENTLGTTDQNITDNHIGALAETAADRLLPLRSLIVTLQCIKDSSMPMFHQPAIYALVKTLCNHPQEWSSLVSIEVPESGRIFYHAGYCYRFQITFFCGGEALLKTLLKQLPKLPRRGAKYALQRNWRLQSLADGLTGMPVENYRDLQVFDNRQLQAEALRWHHSSELTVRFKSPAQLYRQKADRKQGASKIQQMCRDTGDLTAAVFFSRLQDTMLSSDRTLKNIRRQPPPDVTVADSHVFWVDSRYRGDKPERVPTGGLAGWLKFNLSPEISLPWWQLLLLGQHHGIGRGTGFGWGRYELESPLRPAHPRVTAAQSVLQLAGDDDNLARAWAHVTSGADRSRLLEQLESDEIDDALNDDTSLPGELAWDSGYAVEEDKDAYLQPLEQAEIAVPLDALRRSIKNVANGQYAVPELNGYLMAKRTGGYRSLAVPPFPDRVLQRALAQILTPALDLLMEKRSYGFRPGHSRMGARDEIEAAWRDGYRWVFESDVKDFFDSVRTARLRDRLESLYHNDPVVGAIMAWVSAPVRFEGDLIERRNGLPQGSPLSPLLANLMLDDFDSDMRHAGFRMVRFADDFVVLCKSRAQAIDAAATAERSLTEHKLALNIEKTHIKDMDSGFRYLGYLFVGSLALDISGKTEVEKEGTANDAPVSWLRSVEQREPVEIESREKLEHLWQKFAKDGPQKKVGEREQGGEFIALTGTPAVVTTRNKRMQIVRKDKILRTVAWRHVQALLLFGNHQVTTQAAHAAMQQGVCIHMANGFGTYRGALVPGKPVLGHRLWLAQVARFTDDKARLHCARQVIVSRLRHCRETIRQKAASDTLASFDSALTAINNVDNLQSLRGIEGSATRQYYSTIAEILGDKLEFNGRTRRPPRDPFNCLLSLGYQMFYAYCDSITRATGLCPWEGFFHRSEGSHPALISDLIEPFRHIVERTALTAVNRKQIRPEHFEYTAAGGCIMENDARRTWLALLVTRLQVSARARGEDQSYKLVEHMHRQALSLRRFITEGEAFTSWRML